MEFREQAEMHRAPSEAELEEAKDVAARMALAIPEETKTDIVIAAIGILLQKSFLLYIKKHVVVRCFEDFAYHCRQQIAEGTRNAGH